MKKFPCLKQLGLKDHSDPDKTFLYNLSKADGLGYFRHIILVSSPQDTYSPYDSSRIQVSKQNSSNLRTSQAYFDMVDNILSRIKSDALRRVDCCLKFSKSSIDTFIGRAAHISLISDGVLLEVLGVRYAPLL